MTVSLSQATTQTVKVQYATANGTAMAGSDYTSTMGTLTFNAGETSKTINVPILNDNISEPDENFTLNLFNPTNGVIGTGTTTITITDTLESNVTTSLPSGVENLTLSGTANINGTGNELNNVIRGNSGNNILNGGIGADTMIGGKGNDTYYVDNRNDRVVENLNEGIDTVRSTITYTLPNHVENLTLSGTANINGRGNRLNNVIRGNSGNNILNGGIGADTMIGGKGNDTYYVDNRNDRVVENLNEGIDTVRSTITYTLPNHVEHLILSGSSNTNGTGNNLPNRIVGNSGNNRLNGGYGNDTLIGGAGNDTLTGGGGNDTLIGGTGNDTLTGGGGNDFFRFNSPNEGVDRITDFNVTEDTILISRSGFGGGLPLGVLSANRFRVGSSASTTNHRFFYNSNNGGLFFDVDGNATTSAVRIATLNTGLAFTHDKITII
ncbi:Calx-beta domain-containing protein [Geminocystis sp. CENA526]|uniref:Calx-beta domain-containing protein n=1 Tax=Geminocystis sp. CENA526 TaxID=1355871 RepID=UPI003D6DD7BF